MNSYLKDILAKKGQAPIINAINQSCIDLSKEGYNRAEIKETIRDMFYGVDAIVDAHIIKINM